MGRHFQENRPFLKALPDEPEFPGSEVSQPSVNQAGGSGGSSGGQVGSLHQADIQPSQGCVPGHRAAGGAASHHHEIVDPLRQGAEMLVTIPGAPRRFFLWLAHGAVPDRERAKMLFSSTSQRRSSSPASRSINVMTSRVYL